MLCACQPKGDEARSREATAEGGAVGSADRSSGDPVAKGAENVVLPPVEEMVEPAPANTAEAANTAAPPPAVTDLAIPPRYHGRWGLMPADCTSTRGDAKGLITIDGRTIRFYESVGTLAERRPAVATSFAGRFTVTGEGMNWERVITLGREGDRLTRADEDGRFTYTRCPA
jgi:hypothetical protein